MFTSIFRLYHSADTWAAVCIAIMTCGTMFPMSAYTGKILLQVSYLPSLGKHLGSCEYCPFQKPISGSLNLI